MVLGRSSEATLQGWVESKETQVPVHSVLPWSRDRCSRISSTPGKDSSCSGSSYTQKCDRSYLGLLTYYGKFLPNLATQLAPLYKLLSKWNWSTALDKAFCESNKLLTSSKLLIHFNSKLPLLLSCDASAYGIGAHQMSDGSEKPIGYAYHTLNKAEQNYSQLEKVDLSCIFGIKRFYSYFLDTPLH